MVESGRSGILADGWLKRLGAETGASTISGPNRPPGPGGGSPEGRDARAPLINVLWPGRQVERENGGDRGSHDPHPASERSGAYSVD